MTHVFMFDSRLFIMGVDIGTPRTHWHALGLGCEFWGRCKEMMLAIILRRSHISHILNS